MRKLYIAFFTLLGAMVGFLTHGLLEIFYIQFILSDYETFTFGLSWRAIMFLHGSFVVMLTAGGAHVGYLEGKYWWHAIYEKGRHGFFKRIFKR